MFDEEGTVMDELLFQKNMDIIISALKGGWI